jgi:hypothetical protein
MDEQEIWAVFFAVAALPESRGQVAEMAEARPVIGLAYGMLEELSRNNAQRERFRARLTKQEF